MNSHKCVGSHQDVTHLGLGHVQVTYSHLSINLPHRTFIRLELGVIVSPRAHRYICAMNVEIPRGSKH